MSRTYNKISENKPFSDPQTEREDLINQCWSIGVSVPYASNPEYCDLGQLRDITQAQFEKIASEPEFSKGHISEETKEGLAEHRRWRERRKLGDLFFAMPGITT